MIQRKSEKGKRSPAKAKPKGRKPVRPASSKKKFQKKSRHAPHSKSPLKPAAQPKSFPPLDSLAPDPSRDMAIKAAEAAFDKKAFDVVVLDVKGKSPVTDYLVVASARSTTQLGAVADSVEEALAKFGQKTNHREKGLLGNPDWILLDYFDFMVHVMLNEARAHYKLEDLYEGARILAQYHEK